MNANRTGKGMRAVRVLAAALVAAFAVLAAGCLERPRTRLQARRLAHRDDNLRRPSGGVSPFGPGDGGTPKIGLNRRPVCRGVRAHQVRAWR